MLINRALTVYLSSSMAPTTRHASGRCRQSAARRVRGFFYAAQLL